MVVVPPASVRQAVVKFERARAIRREGTVASFVVWQQSGCHTERLMRSIGALQVWSTKVEAVASEEDGAVAVWKVGVSNPKLPVTVPMSEAELEATLTADDVGATTVTADEKWRARNAYIHIYTHLLDDHHS